MRSIFERHSQILNEAEKRKHIAKGYFSLQWPSIKKVSQVRNFWKKYNYTVFNKRHVGSKDAENENDEEVEEEFVIVSETFENTESGEYDSRSSPDVLSGCENISVAGSLSQNDQKMHCSNSKHNKTKTCRRKTTNPCARTFLGETLSEVQEKESKITRFAMSVCANIAVKLAREMFSRKNLSKQDKPCVSIKVQNHRYH